MLTIASIEVNHLREGCVTDAWPVFSFSLSSDREGEALESARLTCGEWRIETEEQTGIRYEGPLEPFTQYTLTVEAKGTSGDTASARTAFTTGRLHTPWRGQWIGDKGYQWPDRESPVPMVLRRSFALGGNIERAWINATALGIYDLLLNGERVTDCFFAPGFTSYYHQIQYQTYDVTKRLALNNVLEATVAGGWAAGSFHYSRKSHIATNHPAFLMELWVLYTDGNTEVIATDERWEVTHDGAVRMADWYDGETYDATATPKAWKRADVIRPRGKPRLLAQYGLPVRPVATLAPISSTPLGDGRVIYDFGQNFAGVIHTKLTGKEGQTMTIRHAEAQENGGLYTKNLRTAKATITYTCKGGYQEYTPRFTYMGFRYVEVRGVKPDELELSALALCSDMRRTSSFDCSNPLLRRLHENIRWSAFSNFIDIPTDCPQRDERLGWTGDIAVFASTASKLFDTSRFFEKWLMDLRAEQSPFGGLPAVVPRNGDAVPRLPTACWGDSCILVPWAEYMARGDKGLLAAQYPAIRRYLGDVCRWAAFLSVGKKRYIWKRPFQYGDWCAPYGYVKDWMRKGPWIATAYYANDCELASRIADLLGKPGDADRWRKLRDKIADAYVSVFTDGQGKLHEEFQSAYVLPLAFGMVKGAQASGMARNLAHLIERDGGRLTTGFPGTPYLLFALSDNGYADVAYQLLLQEEAPGWLYAVKAGATTVWEQWVPVLPDGTMDAGKESSLNHYAYGAVGDFLYRRVLGIEPVDEGYKTFTVAPVPGGGLSYAKGHVDTPYGRVSAAWSAEREQFSLTVCVPVSTTCHVTLPSGEERTLGSGTHALTCTVQNMEDGAWNSK